MDYPIYTYGGGELLISVFNAIGMIFKTDNVYLTPVGSTAMLLGGIYGGTKAIFKADLGFISRWMLPSLIVFLLLFSPKSTVWINDEVEGNAPTKIDNIPVGISFFTSFASTISHHLSKLLEETMLPVGLPIATSNGILYGAKAVAKLRDTQIEDPILLRNVKEYMRQCYMKPYVIGNFGGLKSEAVKATNIMSFLQAHPVKCFGIKFTNTNGQFGKFMTCTEAGTVLSNQIDLLSNNPSLIGKLGAAIGIASANTNSMNARIKAMTSNTFTYLEQEQTELHEWMKQSMILNANREAYDDWREKVGHARVFPELVKMQATRGMFQQAFGSIVGGEMAESMIPVSAQPVMLALVVMCFVIILPFALLPGGWQYIVTGTKLMIWVCSWPVFYTIINAIVMIQIKNAVGSWGDSGLSLVGQGGFTEILLMKYSAVQSLITAVPFISFAVVFGSPHALSSLAGGIASASSAGAIGANMADNNLSLGQTSIGNTTRNQHNEVPTLLFGGGVIDDGTMRVQSDSGGKQIITEHQDQLGVNYNITDSLTSQTGFNLSNAKSAMASITNRESEQDSIVKSQSIDVARSIAQGTTTASNLSMSEVESLRNGFGIDKSGNKSESVVDGKSTGTSSNLGANIPGAITALTGLSGGTSSNASNTHEVRSDMSMQERQAFNTALDKVKSAAQTDSLTTNNSKDMRVNKSFAATLSKQKQIASEKAKTEQDIDTYSKQLSYLESNSGSINRNANNQVMENVMTRHPELKSKEQTARWMQKNRAETDEIAKDLVSSYNVLDTNESRDKIYGILRNTPDVETMQIATVDELQDQHSVNTAEVKQYEAEKRVTDAQKATENKDNVIVGNSNLGYNKSVSNVLNDNLNSEDQQKIDVLDKGRIKYEKSKNDVQEEKDKTYNSTAIRVIENVGNNSTKFINSISGDNKEKKDK